MPSIGHWLMWKEKCALALCPADVHPVLQGFVHERFRRYGSRYARAFCASGSEAASPDARDAWHSFETYFRLHATRKGKSYKEWLFARGAVAAPAGIGDVESGVSLLLRDVVRDHLRHEHAAHIAFSLEAGALQANDGATVSLKELLPDDFDTADAVERHEIDDMAATLAGAAFETLSFRQRVALFGREAGVSLAHPVLVRAAGCGKSVLSVAYQSALAAVARFVADAYPGEPRDSQAALAVAVFDIIKSRLISWARSEKRLAEFLNTVETVMVMTDQGGSSDRKIGA